MGKTYQDLVREAAGRVREITADDVLTKVQRSEGFVLLDVREAEEFQRGHLPGALLIPRGVLEGQAPQMIRDREAEIIAYCGSGMRSLLAADVLQQLGYRNVRSMAGGIRAWMEIGGPLQH